MKCVLVTALLVCLAAQGQGACVRCPKAASLDNTSFNAAPPQVDVGAPRYNVATPGPLTALVHRNEPAPHVIVI